MPQLYTARVFFPPYFSCSFCRFFIFVFLPFSFVLSTFSRKWGRALFLLQLRHLFLPYSGHLVKEIAKLLKTSEQCVSRRMVKSKNVRRQTKETPRSRWPFFYKLWEKCYRKSCKYMRNISTRLKSNKKLHLNNIRVSSTKVRRYVTNKGWKAFTRKMAMHTSCRNGICSEERTTSRQTHVIYINALATIWIIVDETRYKDPAPKILDELRQRLRFALNIDTRWELKHSIPHLLENVRKHKGRYSSCSYFS